MYVINFIISIFGQSHHIVGPFASREEAAKHLEAAGYQSGGSEGHFALKDGWSLKCPRFDATPTQASVELVMPPDPLTK
jgi:hypothetical protein